MSLQHEGPHDVHARVRQLHCRSKFYDIVQLVQQRAFLHRPCSPGIFCFQTLGDLAFQISQILGTEFLGQLIVDLGRNRRFDFLDGASEDGFFARQMLGLIILGEGHGHVFGFTGLAAHQLFFKPRDEAAGAQNQRVIFGRAAVELLAVNGADEIEYHLVAIFGSRAFVARFEILCSFGQIGQRFLDNRFIGLDDHTLQLNAAQVDFGDFR